MPFGDGHSVIDETTPLDRLTPPGMGRGLVPRDYAAQPIGSLAGSVVGLEAAGIPIIPRADRYAMAKEKEELKSRISDIRRKGNKGGLIPSLNQTSSNYCWAHSGVNGQHMLRAVMGLPYVPLSAYAVAATIMGGANQGGWGAKGVEFGIKFGVPAQNFWPQGSFDVRRHNTAEMQANAALHKIGTQVADLASPVYSRSLSDDEVETLLLLNCPVIFDLNWWGHSVLGIDLVTAPNGELRRRILNSYGDEWEDRGEAVLSGDRMRPDGAVALLSVSASVA